MSSPGEPPYPDNPVLARVWRGDWVESQHRGAWVVADAGGRVLAGRGHWEAPVLARSSVKSLQALPLLETGAAARWGFSDEELALVIASHGGEPAHVERVAALLARLGRGPSDLHCGAHPPSDAGARSQLFARGESPSTLHNNCSGKHAGFLGLAAHLGAPPESYLERDSPGQRLVHAAVAEMAGVDPAALETAVDGCSAPTFRLPLQGLACAFARVANPDGLAPDRRAACRRLTAAAASHPTLVAASHGRLCTEILRASGGRLFPKVGAEAVYAVGEVGAGRALAVKIDDGGARGLAPLVVGLLEALGFARPSELEALESWRERPLRNHAGLEVGHVEVEP